jgi:uncharacterized Zn finger protein
MSWGYSFPPYVSVAQRRAKAAAAVKKALKGGAVFLPIAITGRTIARTFWGKAWCDHLASFSDYENRLPRGRAYVRNGSVIHLKISKGCVEAQVVGSSLYSIKVGVSPLAPARWAAIKGECAGKIDSLVGLLQGKLSEPVMRIITERERGLFPGPLEIKKACSCPDSAGLCKHLAAVFYGVGARLDAEPELLFLLRGVDHLELIEGAAAAPTFATGGGTELAADQLADVFGIEIETGGTSTAVRIAEPETPGAARPRPKKPAPATKAKVPASQQNLKKAVKKKAVLKKRRLP